VREERADVGFVEGLDPLGGLDTKVVARDQIVLVVAADHRWAHRRFVNPRELTKGRWIARESGSGMRAVAAAALAEVGVELHPDLSLASLEGVKRSLAAGGFALISELALEPDLAAGRLVALPLKGLKIERSLIAIRRTRARPHEQAKRFWAWLPSVG
jgi:DNA-binding transcriptional LysR family regulator